jgi:hypothetical protein
MRRADSRREVWGDELVANTIQCGQASTTEVGDERTNRSTARLGGAPHIGTPQSFSVVGQFLDDLLLPRTPRP